MDGALERLALRDQIVGRLRLPFGSELGSHALDDRLGVVRRIGRDAGQALGPAGRVLDLLEARLELLADGLHLLARRGHVGGRALGRVGRLLYLAGGGGGDAGGLLHGGGGRGGGHRGGLDLRGGGIHLGGGRVPAGRDLRGEGRNIGGGARGVRSSPPPSHSARGA